MTRPITLLMEEHRLIEQVLTSCRVFASDLGGGDPNERRQLGRYVRFFREFADACHHGKEEAQLFTAMARHGFDAATGPLAVMHHDHDLGRSHVAVLAAVASAAGPLDDTEIAQVRQHVTAFADLLVLHIRKEDGMLYPMAVQVLAPAEMVRLEAAFEHYDRETVGAGTMTDLLQLAADLVADPTGMADVDSGATAHHATGGQS